MIPSTIHFRTNDIILFPFIHHLFIISSSVDGHRGCFHSLTIVNYATINTSVQIPVQLAHAGLGIHQRTVYLDHIVVLFLVFWGTSLLISIMPILVYISTDSIEGLCFLVSSPIFTCIDLYSWRQSLWLKWGGISLQFLFAQKSLFKILWIYHRCKTRHNFKRNGLYLTDTSESRVIAIFLKLLYVFG